MLFFFKYADNFKIKIFLTYFPWAEKLIFKISERVLTALYSFDYCMSSIFLEFRMIEIICNIYFIHYLAGICWCSYFHNVKISLLPSLPRAWTCSKQREASDEIRAYVLALMYIFSNQKTSEKISRQHCFLFRTVLLLMSLCPNNGSISFLCVFNYVS